MPSIGRPFETLLNLQRALDSYRASRWLEGGLSGGGTYPPINVFREADDFTIIAEVPGVQKSDLEVQVKGRTVRISGTKSVDYPDASSVHRRERLSGRFDRALSLPFEIDADAIQAECRDGILALRLSRSERDKPRTITVG